MDEAKALENFNLASASYYDDDDDDDDDMPSCRTIVRGLPDVLSKNDLYGMIDTFSAFGEVRVPKLGTGYAVLEFSTPEEAKRAVAASEKINFLGHVLNIKMKKAEPKHFNYLRNSCGDYVVDPVDLDLSGTFSQQVNEITHIICFHKKDVDDFPQIAVDVQEIMRQYWPDCKAVLYGSMTTGLPTITSDADCFLHIPNNQNKHNNINVRMFDEKPFMYLDISSPSNVNGPSVRFYHIPTGVYCLLYEKNYLYVYNSRLVKFLLGANKKFIPTALLIKYWAGVNSLSASDKVSSYALTIMFIFFLQQELGYIPSVQYLQRNSHMEIIIDNWNAGFLQSYEMLPNYSDTCELPDMLGRFFAFYANFNFKDNMICPFLGHIIPKSNFDNPRQLPSVFDKYKDNLHRQLVKPLNNKTPIVIQDPLQLNDNLGSLITSKFAEELQEHFRFAAATYEEEKNNDYKDFLKKILIKNPRPDPLQTYTIKETWDKYIETHSDLESWKYFMINNFLMILKNICRISLYDLEESRHEETLKVEQSWIGTIKKPIWERENNTPINKFFFEIEKAVTDRILHIDNRTFQLEFNLTIWHYEDSGSLSFDLSYGYGDYMAFMQFGAFFEDQLAKWLRLCTDRLISEALFNSFFSG